MFPYVPELVPDEFEDIPEFLRRELDKLRQSAPVSDVFFLQETNSAPDKPTNGEMRLADGTNWDPIAAGRGIYWYDGDAAAWVKL